MKLLARLDTESPLGMEFFRFCPGCGRRFHIKLESKQLVRSERQERPKIRVMNVGGRASPLGPPPMTLVYDDESVIVNVEEFQYNYKCKHCGHEWSNKRTEEHGER